MFWFTQEPSSGSSPVLSQNYEMVFLWSSVQTQYYGGISACCAGVRFLVAKNPLASQEGPWSVEVSRWLVGWLVGWSVGRSVGR